MEDPPLQEFAWLEHAGQYPGDHGRRLVRALVGDRPQVVAPADVEPQVPLELLALLRRAPVAPHEPTEPIAQHRERVVHQEERVLDRPRPLRMRELVHQALSEVLLQDRAVGRLLVRTDAHQLLGLRDLLQHREALADLRPRLTATLLPFFRLDPLELLLLPRTERFSGRKRASCRVQDAAAGQMREQPYRDPLQATVGLEGLELVELELALPRQRIPAPPQRDLVEGTAVLAVALEPPGDRSAAAVVLARHLALRDLRDQTEEDQVIERGSPQAAVDAEGLHRERALAALALVALDLTTVADATEGAATLVLESLGALALGTLTRAEGGLEGHRRVLIAKTAADPPTPRSAGVKWGSPRGEPSTAGLALVALRKSSGVIF